MTNKQNINKNLEIMENDIKTTDAKFFVIENDFCGYLEFNKRREEISFIDKYGYADEYCFVGTYSRLQVAMNDLFDFFKRPDFEDYVEEKSKYSIYFIQVKNGKKTEKKVFNIRAKDIEIYMNY